MINANASGVISGKFTVPTNVQAGNKRVTFAGTGGSFGEAIFSGQGSLQRKVLQVVTTTTESRWTSPPPPVSYDPPGPGQYVPDTIVPTPSKTKYELGSEIITAYAAQLTAGGFSDASSNLQSIVKSVNALVAAGNTAGADVLLAGGVGTAVNATDYLIKGEITDGGVRAAAHWSACVTDPLAQTFILPRNTQVAAIDLWFTAKGPTPIRVDIRGVSNGFPNREIFTSVTILPEAVAINGAHTRVAFQSPVALQGDTEYAIVVLSNDAVTALSVAELGKYDPANGRWVTSQPYNVGVLLSSSNAITWTPHQDRDMAFRILRADYTTDNRTINLGSVAVTNATDLILMSYAERPASAAVCTYRLTLPGGEIVSVADGQSVLLPSVTTGNVDVSVQMFGDNFTSPVLFPGTQLASGTVASTADYITRSIPAGTSARVKIIYDAFIPGGATVNAFVRGIDMGDAWQVAAYQTSTALEAGWLEVTHELASISKARVHIKLTLAGSSAARPRVRNLRVIVL